MKDQVLTSYLRHRSQKADPGEDQLSLSVCICVHPWHCIVFVSSHQGTAFDGLAIRAALFILRAVTGRRTGIMQLDLTARL
jgi:hypothetical protein